MRSEDNDALAFLIQQGRDINAEIRSIAHSMGRVEGKLETGQRVHDWLTAHTQANRGELIRIGTELRNVQRQIREQSKEGGDPISKLSAVKEFIETVKEFWPYLASAGLIAMKFAGHWLEHFGAR